MPPVKEQKRIADYLDVKCARIDEVIEKTRTSIEEYKKLKRSIITQAVTKGIRPKREMKTSGNKWIQEIPSNWHVCKLKWLCSKITDGSHFSPESIAEGYPYITAKDVKGIGIDYSVANRISEDDYKLLVKNGCRPEKDDVLLVKDGATTGREGLMVDNEECVLLSSVAKLTPKKGRVTSSYLMYLLESDPLQKQIEYSMAGSAMPRTTLSKIVEYYGLMPSFEELDEITKYLDEQVSRIDFLIASKKKLLEELEVYKKAVVFEYVTGKKEVA